MTPSSGAKVLPSGVLLLLFRNCADDASCIGKHGITILHGRHSGSVSLGSVMSFVETDDMSKR